VHHLARHVLRNRERYDWQPRAPQDQLLSSCRAARLAGGGAASSSLTQAGRDSRVQQQSGSAADCDAGSTWRRRDGHDALESSLEQQRLRLSIRQRGSPVGRSLESGPPPLDPRLKPVPWADRWFGNASVWTRLPRNGVLPVVRDIAGLGTKFPWWRLKPGNLLVTAAELRTAGGRFTADFPPSGYGNAGFIPSRLTFSSEGCWAVKVSIENSQPLAFVLWVQQFPQS
jgi:hypothetical protein